MAEKIISKGFYTHPSIPNFVCPKQYVVIKKGTENQLFFRFENPKNETLTALSFSVDFYDSDGRLIKNVKLDQQALKAKGNSCFVANRPVVMDEGCVDFKVTVHSARYGDYLYIAHGDEVESVYEKQDTSGETDRVPFLHKLGGLTHRAIAKTIHTPRFFGILVVLILALLFLFLGVKIYNFTRTETLFTLDQIEYTFATDNREDGPIIIVGSRSKASNIIIPDTIEGHDVLAVASGAFSRSNVRTIRFEGKIEIQDNAFAGASGMRSVFIESTASLGERAFYNCSSLTDVVIEKDLETVGESAFEMCSSLVNVSLPDSLLSIEDAAFAHCYNLFELIIPDATAQIGEGIASGCYSLSSIQTPFVGASADDIQNLRYFFAGATPPSLRMVVVTKMDKVGEGLFLDESFLETVNFVSPITEIGAYAFSGCSNLRQFDIPITVESIGNYAFASCSSLKSVVVPEKITALGDGVFRGCTGLVAVKLPNSLSHIGESAFRDCSSLQALNVPFSVISIGDWAISGCVGLTDLTLPFLGNNASEKSKTLSEMIAYGGYCKLESFTLLSGSALPDSAFAGFEKLTAVTLPAELISIGDGCFRDCRALGAVEIPSLVENIGDYAFYGCSSLGMIEIPPLAATVGDYAFSNCTSLMSAVFRGNGTVLGEGIFFSCKRLAELQLSSELQVVPYKMCEGCVSLASVDLPEGVREILGYAFSSCTSLESVTLPQNHLQSIGEFAFSDCKKLPSFVLPSAVQSIGEGAFARCSSFTSAVIPETVLYVGYGVFGGCNGIESITAPSPSDFSDGATFSYYFETAPASLKSVTVSKINGGYLPDYAFQNFSAMEELTLPLGLMGIGAYAFSNCSSLSALTIPDSVTSMGRGMLIGTSALESITIPYAGLNSDSDWEGFRYFYYNIYDNYLAPEKLHTVTVTKATTIPASAFENVRTVRYIHLPETLTEIGEYAFYGCSALGEITLPSSLTYIAYSAFYDCPRLYSVINLSAYLSLSDLQSNVFSQALRIFASAEEMESNTVTSDGYTLLFANDGTWYLTDYTYGSTSLRLPSGISFNSAPVKYALPSNLFYNDFHISYLNISADITKIYPHAFSGCRNLVSVTSDPTDSFEEICENAFVDTALQSIELPSSVKRIGSYAFAHTPLRGITLPAALVTVGNGAFYYCSYLAGISFEMGSQLVSIGESAFSCSPITEITLPASLTTVGSYAFHSCSSLRSVSFETGSQLVSIGESAFSCSPITEITLPASLTNVGNYAFHSCSSLRSVSFEMGSRLVSIGDSAFCDSAVESMVFPASLIAVGGNAFYCCGSLKSISFEEESNLAMIGTYAFYGTALSELFLPASLTSIGEGAFATCANLRTVTLSSAPDIGYIAFAECYGLVEIYNLGGLDLELGSDAYGALARNAIIIHTDPNAESLRDVSVNGLSFKKSDDSWFLMGLSEGSNLTDLVLDDFSYNGTTVSSYVVYKNAFENNVSITSVAIGSAVREIMPYAFCGCSSLSSLTFEKDASLTSIARDAFAYCSAITELLLPDSITEIGARSFLGCTSMEKVLLPEKLESIGEDAFLDCIGLYDVMNMSDLSVAQNTDNGYVGYYALSVRRSTVPLAVTAVMTESSEARFVKHNNGWHLIGLRVTGDTQPVEIPALAVDGVSYDYRIFSRALRSIPSYFSVLLYDCVTKIDEAALYDLQDQTVYFDGDLTAWNKLDKNGIKSDVYTFVSCIHEAGTFVFTYDGDGNITTTVAAKTEQIITAPTCKDTGLKKIICDACAEERSEILPVVNEHTFVDGICVVCESARRIDINEENFDSCGLFENDAAYPFVFDESGVLISANHDNHSTATLKMMVTSKTVVSFSYKVNSERSADYFRVYLNGTQKIMIAGTTSYEAFSVELKAGDILSFVYQKDGSVSSGNDCGYIKDIAVIITEPTEA